MSPSFDGRELRDDPFDWIDLLNKTRTTSGEISTDIVAIDYVSDGKLLNATMWLLSPFIFSPSNETSVKNYGMLIDSDFDNKTGFLGIDYKIEISWDNHTKTWKRVFQQWSPNGQLRNLDVQPNFTGFYEEQGFYVLLTANLDGMAYPDKYKVIFYAESALNGYSITDFSRVITIPPPEISISTSPSQVELRQGDQTTLEVKINSTAGLEPTISLAASQSPDLKAQFKFDTLQIPSYGMASIPLTITSLKNASAYPYTLLLFVNSTFPDEEFISTRGLAFLPPSLKSENTSTTSSILVTVLPALTWPEIISDFWTKLGNPISFIYGILAGISPWIYDRLKNRARKSKQAVN